MPGQHAKDAKDHFPFLADQGMPNLMGAAARGHSLQGKSTTMPGASPQTVTFASLGLADMANATYAIAIVNNSAAGAAARVTARTAAGFTVTGPTSTDALDVFVCGTLKGQLV